MLHLLTRLRCLIPYMCASCNKVCASSIELDRKSHFTHTRELQQADIFDDLKVVQSHFTHTRELQRQRLARVNVKRDVSFHTHARVATGHIKVEVQPTYVSFHTHARVATNYFLVAGTPINVSFHTHARVATSHCNSSFGNVIVSFHTHARVATACPVCAYSVNASLISHTRASCNGRNCANFTAPLFSFLSHLLTHFV